jgi:hypothetical protein
VIGSTLAFEEDGTWVFPETYIETETKVFTVTATDLLGDKAEAQVTVYDLPALELNVRQVTLVVGMSWVFSASGGKSPYTWAVDDVLQDPDPAADPVLNDSFTFRPGGEGEYWVSVTDNMELSQTAVVQVVPDPGEGAALAITPTVAYVLVGDQLAFTALGGTGPYTFSSSASPSDPECFAVPNANPAIYLAGVEGPDTVTLTDGEGASVTAAVTVVAAGEPLAIFPLNPTVSAIGDTVQFTATGGRPPYRFFSKKPAWGSIDPVTGLYTQITVNNVVVGVEDDSGTIATTVVKLVVE